MSLLPSLSPHPGRIKAQVFCFDQKLSKHALYGISLKPPRRSPTANPRKHLFLNYNKFIRFGGLLGPPVGYGSSLDPNPYQCIFITLFLILCFLLLFLITVDYFPFSLRPPTSPELRFFFFKFWHSSFSGGLSKLSTRSWLSWRRPRRSWQRRRRWQW